ncbi:DUF523 domain-containing protein [Desulfovibrio sp. OttesenSCG-928-O18]|nr:DUF523 domain-containing protein [Desulfovibrio sp. OttesenSCG-928-O18]
MNFPILASACLCGIPCRYNARNVPHPELEALAVQGKVVPVCPELLGGLAAPRVPCERRGGRVLTREGEDVTAAFFAGAAKTLALAREKGIAVAVLKDKSPSCGSRFVYDGNFTGTVIPGRGVTAALLLENGFVVYTEETFSQRPNV